MSMTVNGANHMNRTLQSTRATMEQKDRTEEAGKTHQSAVSASMDTVNMGKDGIAIAQVSRQQGTEQTNQQKQSVSPRMDTVEISAEGKAASAKLQVQQSGTDAETGETESYQYETDDLSKYTDAELKQMYKRGEITRQEYEKKTGEVLES